MSTVSWEETKRRADEVRRAAGLPVRTPEEKQADLDRLRSELRARRLVEMRKEQALTQQQIAEALGVTQPRVSAIEHGEVHKVEVATLRAYVEALGGQLKVVAEFGDTSYLVA